MSKLLQDLQDSLEPNAPTYQRMPVLAQKKFRLVAKHKRQTTPQYLASLADREFDKLPEQVVKQYLQERGE